MVREPNLGLRPCARADLPGVAALYESVVRSGRRSPPSGLAAYFERTFFDCPWADPAIPSLVYQGDGGRIVGFVGSHVRRVRCDGRALRFAYGGQLVVEPEARARAVGAMLFRARLQGEQDAALTDGANETVRGMWQLMGGEAAHLKTLTWTRVLRPARFAGDALLGRLGRPVAARRLRALWRPLDAAALKLAGRRLRPAAGDATSEPLTAQAVLEHRGAVTESLRCFPDYDEPYLDWLFHEMAAVKSRGELVRSLVRDGGGRVIGWYVYYDLDGVAQVEQVAARRGRAGEVLDELLRHAHARGAAAVRGRLEPQLAEALSTRRCLFGWSGLSLLQARAPGLLGVLLSSQCWLGRMDGESWMGHHTEAFS